MSDATPVAGVPRVFSTQERVDVATSGEVNRRDYCPECGRLMLYRVTPAGVVIHRFCPNVRCDSFLVELGE